MIINGSNGHWPDPGRTVLDDAGVLEFFPCSGRRAAHLDNPSSSARQQMPASGHA
jgi:hypothetical protein